MKIFFISPNPVWGGAATANMSIAEMLSINNTVIYNDEYNIVNVRDVIYDPFPVHRMKSSKDLLKHIIELKIDFVIWGVSMNLPYYKKLAKELKLHGIKQAVLFHSLSISRDIKGWLIEWLTSRAIKNIDYLVFVSKFTDISWSKYKTVRKHPSHHVIYNPIKVNQICVNFDNDRVGFVGRLSQEKQPQVFAQLSEIDDGNRYIAWGSGDLLSELKDRYPKVEFKGHSSNQNEIYGSFDILVMTSAFENCPMVILEAWKHGIPCVVPNVGGIPEIVKNNFTGILYDGYDVKDILSKINNIKQNYAFFSRNCSEAVKEFSFENIKSKWNDIINYR